ncbi:MAG TPA: HTH domain-containing protein [Nitrososphaerales archaeon]|nr:HTH domain-containing protein [Nitrososphaerales archaeon]
MDEKGITVTYLAKLAGASTQIVWKDVKLLRSLIDEDWPLKLSS